MNTFDYELAIMIVLAIVFLALGFRATHRCTVLDCDRLSRTVFQCRKCGRRFNMSMQGEK